MASKNMKFTDRSIQSLKPQEKRYVVWKDGGKGLGLRVSPKGRKTFVFMYHFEGRARMMTLGNYPRMTLADAGVEHSKAIKLLEEENIDPGTQKVKKNKEERDAETVKELVEEYINRWAKPRKKTWKNDQFFLEREVIPAWGRRKAKSIARRDVISLLDGIVARDAPITANRTLAVIRKMYNWAIGRDILEHNPCYRIAAPAPENKRDRVLTEREIYTLWNALEGADMHLLTKQALKLVLVTAQRPGEIVNVMWKEVDLKNGWWIIPKEKTKNGLPHRVPLNQLALKILETLKPFSTKQEKATSSYLFPSPKKGQHLNVSALSHALRRNDEYFKIEHFTSHDLRRTAASHMTGAGINRLVVSKILNHVEKGVTAVYDRHSYDREKRQALEVWGQKLEQLLTEEDNQSNVVELTAR